MRSVTLTADNELTLLQSGVAYFPALAAAFDSALLEIYLETYIFAADETGDFIKDALKRAAARGVQVNVIVDWLGTGNAQCRLLEKEFAEANVNCRIFNPWFKRGLTRSHRKLCVVDRRVAFLGGLNINDDLRADDDFNFILPAPRWDFAVQIVGPLVRTVHAEAEAQWARIGHLKLRLRLELFREMRQPGLTVSGAPALAALVVRDNLRNRRTIQREYMHALGHARKNAWLANPYFAPGRKMRSALKSAALRGVDVTLLLGVGQFRMQDSVARACYPALLKSGVKIVEYRKTQLHAKVAVVDDAWATVGSSNYDGFSLFLNQEANVVVQDEDFSNILREHIARGIVDGMVVRLEDYENIPWFKRVWYVLAFMLYRGTIQIVTWRSYS